MSIINYPKISGVDFGVTISPGITNYPDISGVGGAAPILLDYLNVVAAGAYSFKNLSSDYLGDAVSVRRASDGTTQDFSAAEVAAGNLETFLNATQGYCVAMYDQSGNGRHIIQATPADQPEVLNDGSTWYLNMIGGDHLRCAAFAGATTNMTMHVLWSCLSDGVAPLVGTFQGGLDFSAGTGEIFPTWWTGSQAPSYKGTGSTDFDWIDGTPRQHVWKWLNGTETCFEFGSQGRATRSVANPGYSRLTVGKNDVQNGNFKFYELVLMPLDVSTDDLFFVTKGNYPQWFSFRKLYLNIGDSNTAAGFVTTGQQWTQKVYNAIGTGPWYSRALGGNTLQMMIDNPERVTFYLEEFSCVEKNVVIFLGTNDLLAGSTPAQTLQLLEDLCDLLRVAGATRITVVTCIDRANTGSFTDAERNTFNASVIANANGKWDATVDTTTNANLEDSTNVTYFVDTTHLSATGQTELANMIITALSEEDVVTAEATLFSQTGAFIDNVAFVNGQTFTSIYDCELSNIQMWLLRIGSPTGNVRLNLHVADDNSPGLDGITSTIIATSSTSLVMGTINNVSAQLYTFDFTGVTLTAGTKYAFAYDPTVVSSVSGANSIHSRRTANPAGVNQYAGGNYSTVGATGGFDLDYNFVVNAVRSLL